MSKFDAAITLLRDFSKSVEFHKDCSDDCVSKEPLEHLDQYGAAIRVLEAAAKVDKAIIESIGDAFCESYGGNVRGLQDPDYLVIRALLAALPDDTKCRNLSTRADKTDRDLVTREWLRFQAGEIWSADTLDDAVDTLADTLTGFGVAVEDGKVSPPSRNIKGGSR